MLSAFARRSTLQIRRPAVLVQQRGMNALINLMTSDETGDSAEFQKEQVANRDACQSAMRDFQKSRAAAHNLKLFEVKSGEGICAAPGPDGKRCTHSVDTTNLLCNKHLSELCAFGPNDTITLNPMSKQLMEQY
eukprot:gb/GEZN01023615.1/.p1 GENE.gb/GEZN01023615.1/~~gb/GEZN01023615.1/.p1  ORF type:complete len:134 (+),score=15.61 gb/GEZN01023615.1/:47-448(+)